MNNTKPGFLITVNNIDLVNNDICEYNRNNMTLQLIIINDNVDDMTILNENILVDCCEMFKRYKLTHRYFTFNDGKCKVLLTDKYCNQFVIDNNLYTVKVDEINYF